MQKFTRALTREIEVGGERLAVTLSAEGVEVRPVGSRRPPHSMSWPALVRACTGGAGQEPTPEEVGEAVKALKTGSKEKKAPAASPEPATLGTPAAPTTHAAQPAAMPGQAQPTEHLGPQPAPAPPAGQPPAPPASAERHTAPQHPIRQTQPSLADLLHRLDHWLSQHRRRFHEALLPGATPAELQTLEGALGAPLPDSLRTWLRWHNGQNADVMGAFVESWNLMSSGQIAEAKKELDAGGHAGWQRGWVPFLDDDQDDYLCLDPGEAGGAVRECWRGNPDHAVVAPSLETWVENFLAALEQGLYYEDPERGTFQRR